MTPGLRTVIPLLFLLAFLWGSSYLLKNVAVSEIPPLTLIAVRVTGAALFLFIIMRIRHERLPRRAGNWRMRLVQLFLVASAHGQFSAGANSLWMPVWPVY